MDRLRAAQRPKIVRRPVHGVLLLDKPLGVSSNAAMKHAQRLFRAEKAGHTGTLDPLATGLLPICFGAATKFSQFSLDADKRYSATLQLGVTTTTGDRDGELLAIQMVTATTDQINAALIKYTGAIEQVPPMYSALKRDGKPLYEYARAGIEVERSARSVTIRSLELVARQDECVVFRVACSKGTYVRTLAEDIGRELGCGAHLSALRRERTGGFGLDEAITLDAIEAVPFEIRDALLLPVDTLIRDLPRIDCGASDAARLRLGQRLAMHSLAVTEEGLYRVYDDAGALTGLVQAISGALRPERLVAQGSSVSV